MRTRRTGTLKEDRIQAMEFMREYGEKLGRSGQRYSPNKGSCTCSFQRKGDSKGQGNPDTDSEGAEYLVEAADDSQEESVGTVVAAGNSYHLAFI